MTPKLRIIVIEDDPLVAKPVERILNGLENASVTVFSTSPFGDDVVKYLVKRKKNDQRIDVLLTDINLDKEVGFEIIRRVMGALSPDFWPKFVVMTGDKYGAFGPNGLIVKYASVEPYIAAMLEKPFSPDALVSIVLQAGGIFPTEKEQIG